MIRRFHDAPITMRLGVAFVLMAVLFVGMAAVGSWTSSVQENDAKALVSNQSGTEAVLQARYLAADFKRAQNAYALDVLAGVPGATVDSVGDRKLFLGTLTAFRNDFATVKVYRLSAADVIVVTTVETDFDKFVAGDDEVIALYRQGTPAAYRRASLLVVGSERALYKDIANSINSLLPPLAAEREALVTASSGDARRSNLFLPLGGAAVIVVALVLLVAMSRSLVRPLRAAQDALRGVAEGDLTRRLAETSGDEVGQLGLVLNQTLDRVSETVDGIAAGSVTLSSASEELSAVSLEMSANAEETAAQAATVSAAAAQVSQNLQSVMASTEALNTRSEAIVKGRGEAIRVAAEGVAAAEDTHDLVVRLGTSSAEIGNVLGVITSVAEQTNLLALNAAIEAARAGEAGKGFAVVAAEVKDLARKTGRSIAEIGRTIETIQSDSQEAVAAISQITATIQRLSDMQGVDAATGNEAVATMRSIERTLRDAALGAGEIAHNITGVAVATQGTTLGAAETHRAAEELATLAGELLRLVGYFRLADGDQPLSPPATAHHHAQPARLVLSPPPGVGLVSSPPPGVDVAWPTNGAGHRATDGGGRS